MRNASGWFCFVLLLGAVAGFAAGRGGDVTAQTVDNRSTRFLAGVVTYGQASDAMLLFDTQTNRLVAYTITGGKRLEVIAVREISWDFKPVSWGKQEPSVQEMKDAFERADKARLERQLKEQKKRR